MKVQGRQIQNFGAGGGGRLLWIEVRKPVCPSVSVTPSVLFSSWLLILSPRFGKTGGQYPQLGRCVTFTKLINLWKVQLYTSNCNSNQEATSHVAAAYPFDLYPKNLPSLHCLLLFFGWGKRWLLQELSCIGVTGEKSSWKNSLILASMQNPSSNYSSSSCLLAATMHWLCLLLTDESRIWLSTRVACAVLLSSCLSWVLLCVVKWTDGQNCQCFWHHSTGSPLGLPAQDPWGGRGGGGGKCR